MESGFTRWGLLVKLSRTVIAPKETCPTNMEFYGQLTGMPKQFGIWRKNILEIQVKQGTDQNFGKVLQKNVSNAMVIAKY